jgi:predicted DNA-binding transcriptional regulator YafY
MRNAEVIRQWKILKRIEKSRHTTAADLAEEHAVALRTIRRDIEALQEAGFPLYDERDGGRKVWRFVEGYQQRTPQTFTLAEMSALYFGRNLMTFLGGAPFAKDLDSAFAKIRSALPEKSITYLGRIGDLFGALPSPAKDYSKKKAVISGLVDATLHEKRVEITYYSISSRRAKDYEVDPYRVVYYQGGLYLYAFVPEYGEVRTFAVERIERLSQLDINFTRKADFDLETHSRSAFGITGGKAADVALVFSAKVAGSIRERQWHESQKTCDLPDGGLKLEMKVAPSRELRSWIKGYLPHVNVLSPAMLRAEIASDIEEASRKWKT